MKDTRNWVIAVYGFKEEHERFVKYLADFRKRYPEAHDTPTLATLRFYNFRFNRRDELLVRHELGRFLSPRINDERFPFAPLLRFLARFFPKFKPLRLETVQPCNWAERHAALLNHGVSVVPLLEFEESSV